MFKQVAEDVIFVQHVQRHSHAMEPTGHDERALVTAGGGEQGVVGAVAMEAFARHQQWTSIVFRNAEESFSARHRRGIAPGDGEGIGAFLIEELMYRIIPLHFEEGFCGTAVFGW